MSKVKNPFLGKSAGIGRLKKGSESPNRLSWLKFSDCSGKRIGRIQVPLVLLATVPPNQSPELPSRDRALALS